MQSLLVLFHLLLALEFAALVSFLFTLHGKDGFCGEDDFSREDGYVLPERLSLRLLLLLLLLQIYVSWYIQVVVRLLSFNCCRSVPQTKAQTKYSTPGTYYVLLQ